MLSAWTLWAGLVSTAVAQSAPSRRGSVEYNDLSLEVTEQTVIPMDNVKSFSEGTTGIVDVRLTGDGSQLVVVGLRAGMTTLLMLMRDGSEVRYRVTVTDPNAKPALPEAEKQEARKHQVAAEQNIRLDLYFVQVERRNGYRAGVNWGSDVGSGTFDFAYDFAARSLNVNSAIVQSELMPKLELAQTQGWAKVLRHVAVITENGVKAEFDTGGEFNVVATSGLNATIKSIKFGSILGVLPVYDAESRRMHLDINADVSDLTEPSANGVPGRNRSVLTTAVNLELGEAISVAGLNAKSESRSNQGIPGLSGIPILGVLFGRLNKQEQETRNLVFIVPSVVEPVNSARARELISEAVNTYDAYSGKIAKVRLIDEPQSVSGRAERAATPGQEAKP